MITGINGKLPSTVGHPESYFQQRGIFLDCRGPLTISPLSHWGWNIQVWTAGHDFTPQMTQMVKRPTVVKARAFIGSSSILYNCVIGINAIVAVGSVIRSFPVPDFTMVEGNPAVVIAEWNGEKWKRTRRLVRVPEFKFE